MTDHEAPRVAILGRAGPAREHLRRALSELGGEIAAEGDPTELSPEQVLATRPGVVVLSMDAAIEEQLDVWGSVLDNEALTVIFDEADTTRQLDGWDLARWARHLASKVLGDPNTLPPAPEGAEPVPDPINWIPSPGAIVTPEPSADPAWDEAFAAAATASAADVPAAEVFHESGAAVSDRPEGAANDPQPAAPQQPDTSFSALHEAVTGFAHEPQPEPEREPEPERREPEGFGSDGFELDGLDLEWGTDSDDAAPAAEESAVAAVPAAPDWSLEETPEEPEPSADQDEGPPASDDQSGFATHAQHAGLGLDDAGWDVESGSLGDSVAESQDSSDPDSLAERFSFDALDLELDEDAPIDDEVAALAAQLDAMSLLDPAERRGAAGEDQGDTSDDAAPEHSGAEASPSRFGFEDAGFSMELEPQTSDDPESTAPEASGSAAAEGAAGHGGAAQDPAPAPASNFGLGSTLALVDDDEPLAPPPPPPTSKPSFSIDELSAAFQLEATDEELASQGVILLLSGMGGPDALRQFLSSLPDGLPAPVLVFQQLNAGTHDRLASQLGKTGRVTTYLARPGGPMASGQVGVIPPGVGVDCERGLRFTDHCNGPADLIAGIQGCGQRASVVVLSGADVAWLEGLDAFTEAGGLVLAQDPDSCFEDSACRALVARGFASAEPAALAPRAVPQWNEDY